VKLIFRRGENGENRGGSGVFFTLATALFIAVSLAISFFLSGTFYKKPKIEQPARLGPVGSGAVSLKPSHLNEPGDYISLDLTPENVPAVVEALARPDEYEYVFSWKLMSGENVLQRTVTVHRFADLELIAVESPGEPTVEYAVTGERIYTWTGDPANAVETARGEFTADMLAGLPTYNDVVEKTPGDITRCAFDYEGNLALICVAAERNGVEDIFMISVDNGMLVRMESKDDYGVFFRAEMTWFEPEPDRSALVLPFIS